MRTKWAPRTAVRGLMVAVVVGLAGCGGPPPPTDKAEGVAVLQSVLEAWQAGEPMTALKDRKPAITVVDHAWSGGTKLAKFEIDADGAQPSGYDLSCPVKLWLGDGKKPPVQVRYVIALAPERVVTRDFGN